ncbi:MAG TPA: extensin family protein [Polyangiaceae bacterium]|nr:extensin family protein [Polyangiaceae bacterium]
MSLLLSCSQIDGRPSAPSAPPRVAASSPSERATSEDAKPAVALPEPANTSGTAIAEQEPGTADLDPNNDEIVAPPEAITDCEARLNALGVSYAAAELKLRTLPGGRVCGAPQALVYKGRPGGIRWSPPPIVTCNLAIALAHFELVVDAEAKQYLGTSVRSIEQGGTYNCRTMARFSNMVSEHSYGNAIDLRRFRLSDGRTVSVLEHFGRPANEPSAAPSKFLRALARKAFDDGVFSVVLTEFFDRLHRDHFHVDMARYRVDGTR